MTDLRPAVDDLGAGPDTTCTRGAQQPEHAAVARQLDQSPEALSNGEPGHSADATPAGATHQPEQQLPFSFPPPLAAPAAVTTVQEPPAGLPAASASAAAPTGPLPAAVKAPWYKQLCGACCGGEPAAVPANGPEGAVPGDQMPVLGLPRRVTTTLFGRTITSPFAADYGGQQVPLAAGMPRRVSTFYTGLFGQPAAAVDSPTDTLHLPLLPDADADWFDARSDFERTRSSVEPATPTISERAEPVDLQRMASEFQAMAGSQWAPDPPLDFADPNARYVQVPENTGFAGYWLSDPERTTPFPHPIDLMLGSSALAIKAHASIPGILITENATEMRMVAKPALMGGMIDYNERFTKDGKTTSWLKRRDLKAGRTTGQMYYTAAGTLIWRVQSKGLWGNAVEWVAEDHMRMEEDGQVLISRQCAKHIPTGKTAAQYLVGRRITH